MNSSKKNIGVYLHIPFCDRKCPYCDFFSFRGNTTDMDAYTDVLAKRILTCGRTLGRKSDTVYLGGGTPSLLGAERLAKILQAVDRGFGMTKDAEVTLEVNPTGENLPDFQVLKSAGFNRLSVGLQSANDEELHALGRLHTAQDAAHTVVLAQKSGFENISLDIMLAIPHQTLHSLEQTICFCTALGVSHVSAYILKVEEGTPFWQAKNRLPFFDDDKQADFYLCACKLLEERGFRQYEISNFSQEGMKGRHNLKYWHDEEYIGLGPSAHSFVDGERFFCPASLKAFYEGKSEYEGDGGDEREYIMLGLRLREGIRDKTFFERFGTHLPEEYINRAARFAKAGLTITGGDFIRLTRKGFLLSNPIIAEILG